ncbi:shikimate kinase [Saccharophagus degradans]|uniref:shikimate kinase n=1 Tax=Saccharophagus degradans TaxID=86304 RepID=UPI0024782100|nr:shikimate kinase [Saccharophagus degradans]WGO97315.1 shikimate kinase [Saccharophagus degradans]
MQKNDSITLIGMPGAGKSTLGVQLAKTLAKQFVDTDLLIQQAVGMSLQQYLEENGYLALREQEQQVLLSANLTNAVVSTGGSAVYSEQGMARLQKLGPCIYLQVSFQTMQHRVTNASSRGLAVAEGTTLKDLYTERLPLYERWATHTVNCDEQSQAGILQKIEQLLLNSVG